MDNGHDPNQNRNSDDQRNFTDRLNFVLGTLAERMTLYSGPVITVFSANDALGNEARSAMSASSSSTRDTACDVTFHPRKMKTLQESESYIKSIKEDSRWEGNPKEVFDAKVENLIGQLDGIPFGNTFNPAHLPQTLCAFAECVKKTENLLNGYAHQCHEQLGEIAEKYLVGEDYVRAIDLLNQHCPTGAQSLQIKREDVRPDR